MAIFVAQYHHMSASDFKFRDLAKKIFGYFMQGVLLIAPIFFTVLAIYKLFDYFDSTANNLFQYFFHFSFPGFGIMMFVAFITLVGLVGSTVLIHPIVGAIEKLLENTPLVKDIYSSLKDFVSAFISNKKKFDKPVLMEMGKGSGIFRPGFITSDDLSEFGIHDKVAVYLPQSYTFAGHLYFVNRDQITPLDNISPADTMKYIISGGVVQFEEEDK
jgi:uncharacterized membrane protein